MEQVENSISRTKDKVEELDPSDKDTEKNITKIWIEHARLLGNHQKTNSTNCDYRRYDTN
jgi:prefoldin subunit 5